MIKISVSILAVKNTFLVSKIIYNYQLLIDFTSVKKSILVKKFFLLGKNHVYHHKKIIFTANFFKLTFGLILFTYI